MRFVLKPLALVGAAAVSILFSQGAQASFAGLAGAAKADRNATLTRLETSYPKTLNPIIFSTATEADIILDYNVFETLVAMDPDTGKAACWLCTTYEYSPDKKVVTFKLRKDVKFHDGKPLTAQDVKFSFDVMVNPKVDNLNNKSDVMAAVAKVEAPDDYTVKITFKKAKYSNIYQIGVPVIPKHLFPYFAAHPEQFNKDQKFGRHPIGSGPYKFVKWEGDQFVEIERNDDWWGFKSHDPRFKNDFNFKRIRFKIITNDNVALQAFKKGEFDYTDLASYQYDQLSKEKSPTLKVKTLHLEPKVGTSFMFIGWNTRLPMFSDVKTREALELLTHRQATLAKFSKGLRPPTNGPWGINSPYQCPKEQCPVAPFDPAKAKKLLAEAGWKDTNADGCLDRTVKGKMQTLRFSILTDETDWSKNVLMVYATDMKKAGVCVTLRQLDWTAMQKLVDDLNFQAYLSGWQSGYPILPRQLWYSGNTGKTGSNTTGFKDKVADQLIDQFESEFDDQKRIEIGRKLHKRIYDAHTMLWHHEGGGCYMGINKSLQGVEVADYQATCIYWPRWYKEKK